MLIAVSIVEDNHGMREGFAALLNRAPGMKCVGAYATGEEAVVSMPADNPNLTVEQAWDIAAYVESQPRPALAGIDRDYPDRALKPAMSGVARIVCRRETFGAVLGRRLARLLRVEVWSWW